MALVLSSAPTTEPITVQEVKDHSRISVSADDATIQRYIKFARTQLENALGSAFVTQTWTLYLDTFPASEFLLPRAPLQSVTSIKYTDEDSNQSAVSSDDYLVDSDSKPGRVTLKSGKAWPATTLQENNAIEIIFVAGYGARSAVPEPIRQALLLMVADAHEYRESVLVEPGLTRIDMGNPIHLVQNYNMKTRGRALT